MPVYCFSWVITPRLTPLSERGDAKLIAPSGGKFPRAIALRKSKGKLSLSVVQRAAFMQPAAQKAI